MDCSGFITLGIYTPLEARIIWQLRQLPINADNSIYTNLINLIYFWVPSSCFA